MEGGDDGGDDCDRGLDFTQNLKDKGETTRQRGVVPRCREQQVQKVD